MCTSIVEIAAAEGMAKGDADWFKLTHAVVSYDHARHALLVDAITIDFINSGLPPGARAAVELTLDAAKALNTALTRAIAAAEAEEALRSQAARSGSACRRGARGAGRCVGRRGGGRQPRRPLALKNAVI